MICLPHDPQRGVVRQVGFYDLMSSNTTLIAQKVAFNTAVFNKRYKKRLIFKSFIYLCILLLNILYMGFSTIEA